MVASDGARRMVPVSNGRSPTMRPVSVDFPEPFGPTTAVTSLSASVKVPTAMLMPEMARMVVQLLGWLEGQSDVDERRWAGTVPSVEDKESISAVGPVDCRCSQRGWNPNPELGRCNRRWQNDMAGYAVVDLETTGLFPGGHDRIVEVGVVLVSPAGEVEGTWETLLNPGRDLGRQDIHGICAADVLGAPTFPDVAATLAELLRGRTFVAHNASFDSRFVAARYAWLGYEVPVAPETSVCTMRWGSRLIPGMPRTLAGACAHVGVQLGNHHSALADAKAAAGLLRQLLDEVGAREVPWRELCMRAERAPWPIIPGAQCPCVRRGNATAREVPYLARLVDSLPDPCGAVAEAEYLALLDRALLDRFLSVREQAALVAAAGELGIDQPTAMGLHRIYLDSLARAALADGLVTPAEREDLAAVAQLLDLDPGEVDTALAGSDADCGARRAPFQLDGGDMVVFTGEMSVARAVWEKRAEEAGLVPRPSVTKKVKLVVAADPDSLSGKARKAADYGIPIVTEEAFAVMLERARRG